MPQVRILVAMGEIAERMTGVIARTAGNTVGPSVSALMAAAAISTGNIDLAFWATPVGAAVGAFTEEGASLVRRAWSDRAERAQEFAEVVAEVADVPLDEVPLLATHDASTRRLLGVTLEAATEANSHWRISMLAKVFVEGYKDPAAVDRMVYLVRLLESIEAPEMRLFAAVWREGHAAFRGSNDATTVEKNPLGAKAVNLANTIAVRDPALLPVLEVLKINVDKAGLLRLQASSAHNAALTPLGFFCVRELLRLQALPGPGAE